MILIIVKEQKRLPFVVFFSFLITFFSLPIHTSSKVKSAAHFVFMKLNVPFDVRKITK